MIILDGLCIMRKQFELLDFFQNKLSIGNINVKLLVVVINVGWRLEFRVIVGSKFFVVYCIFF